MAVLRQAFVPAFMAALISFGMGLIRAYEHAGRGRAAGWDVGQISGTWKHEITRWSGLALTTGAAVLVVVLLSRVAQRRQSRLLEALLVLAAPVLLLSAGVAAYWPERGLIEQGWYVNVGELALFWGLVCGGPVIIIAEAWFRTRRLPAAV